MSFDTITQEALALEPMDRARLMDSLFESLAVDDEQASRLAAWTAEAESRSRAVAEGLLETFDETEVLAGLRNSVHA